MGFGDFLAKYSGYDATKKGLGQIGSGDFSGLGSTIVGQLNSADVVGNQLGLPHLGDPMAKADTTGLNNAANQSSALAGQLGNERAQFMAGGYNGGGGGNVPGAASNVPGAPGRAPGGGGGGGQFGFGGTTAPTTGNSIIDQSQIGGLRSQQQNAINSLAAAANGQTPSAAELAGRNLANRAAAQQFGQAAALQGGLSAGGALRRAQQGSAGILGQNAADTMVNRAQEQANARNALVGALSGARGQEQDLATGQAGLNQQTNLANLSASLANSGQNLDWMKSLLSGQLTSQNTAVTGQSAMAQANAAAAAAKNAKDSAIFGTGATLLGSLSDRREKKDIKPADLDKLADSLVGYNYRYKDEANGSGPRVGIMAQDAEKGGPIGKDMVRLGADGKRRLDIGNALGAALAMSAKALREAR